MRCPYCESLEDKVVDSRSSREGRAIRRRRECLNCERRFTTYEYVESVPLTVIKVDGRREPFDRSKVLEGIRVACYKTTVSVDEMEDLVDHIEARLSNLATKEVTSKEIGELVVEGLKDLNEVAYVRFASVYRQFKDKREFLEELKQLNNTRL